jgi:hypothetical protein
MFLYIRKNIAWFEGSQASLACSSCDTSSETNLTRNGSEWTPRREVGYYLFEIGMVGLRKKFDVNGG